MSTPPVQRYNIHGMLWGQRLVRAEQDDGEWVKWDDHTTSLSAATARAEKAEAESVALEKMHEQPVIYLVYIDDGSNDDSCTNVVAATTKEAAIEAQERLRDYLRAGMVYADVNDGPERYRLAGAYRKANPSPFPIEHFLDGWGFCEGWDVDIEEIPTFRAEAQK